MHSAASESKPPRVPCDGALRCQHVLTAPSHENFTLDWRHHRVLGACAEA